jgi:hypothetical protein
LADGDAGNDVHSLDLARDAVLLTDTVREAGRLALSLFRTELKNWIKGASSPVSEADIAVNELIARRLRSVTPNYGWLSEESADDQARVGKRLVWIVDPIDGTRAYLAGREDWCVSAALVEDAQPVIAAVFARRAMNSFLRNAGMDRSSTEWRSMRRRAPGLNSPVSPVRSRWSNGLIFQEAKFRFIRGSDRWRSACAGSPTGSLMPLLRAAKAAIGILRRQI